MILLGIISRYFFFWKCF